MAIFRIDDRFVPTKEGLVFRVQDAISKEVNVLVTSEVLQYFDTASEDYFGHMQASLATFQSIADEKHTKGGVEDDGRVRITPNDPV